MSSFAVRRGPWKLIERKGLSLYNLEVDRREERNLSMERPRLVRSLRRTRPPDGIAGDPATLGEAALKQLRALGYLE